MPKIPTERSPSSSDARRQSINTQLSITCAPCRAKKIKCDSTKPTCMNCAKAPSECHYPPKLKPGLRPGTGLEMIKRVELLEERIETYEARLAEQETRLAQIQQNAAPSFSYDTQTPLNDPFLQSTQSNTFNSMMPPQSIAPGQTSITSLPTNLSNASVQSLPLVTDPSPTSGFDPMGLGISASPGLNMASPSSFLDPHILPSDDIVRDLLTLFFTHIHPWAPILSPTIPEFKPPWTIVHHAIVVVTLRLSSDPRLSSTKDLIKKRAKQHVLAHAIESTSISSVQALALLALDLIGSEQGPSSWGILALLTRSAVHLGLSKEEETPSWAGIAPLPALSRTVIIPPASSWHEDESRRRLFWLIFCLDRYACVATGWDFALPDSDIKRRLPCSDAVWNRPDWHQSPPFRSIFQREHLYFDLEDVSPMAYLVEALDLLGRAHTLQSQLLEPGDASAMANRKDKTLQLTASTRGWFANAPLERIEQPGMRLMIQAAYYATLLKLNGNHAYPAHGEPEEPYVSTCLDSAKAMANLTTTARAIGWKTTSSPVLIWGCWVAARVIFVHAFLNHQTQPDDNFNTILAALKEQAVYWSLANQYVKLLERAKRKWQNSLGIGTSGSSATTSLPDAIHVLLDFHRTAYSAVHQNNIQETPNVSPPEHNLSHLPVWAVQPGLGDLYSWFDLPVGLFPSDTMSTSMI
ncbi:uncharacterized protein L201_004604 [Kwoniella dendrophila CBS 6074]|uniref:Zn(2)-C6 fungal-type domain-containing protein n=1 Tax=Kwoniella dendrophila CBS 6074 TaxID=1295534 RepID=A0AAX4JXS5_9TREE